MEEDHNFAALDDWEHWFSLEAAEFNILNNSE